MSGDWELTQGLQNLRRQVDTRFPRRDTTTDGTIGNAAHQEKTSGHNPDDTSGSKPAWNGDKDSKPEVRAWDMDHDLDDPWINAQDLVDWIRHLNGVYKAIRYIIYKGVIYHANNGFNPEPSSGHETHVHFEGAWTDAGDESNFDFRLEELGNPMSVQDVRDYFESAAAGVRGTKADGKTSADAADRDARDDIAAVFRFAWGLNYADQTGSNLAPARLNAVENTLTALPALTADATVEALVGSMDSLVSLLHNGLTVEQLADLRSKL